MSRPLTLLVASLKGGVGKTSTAVTLAHIAQTTGDGPAVLLDLDEHLGAVEWAEQAAGEGVPLPFSVVDASRTDLASSFDRLTDGAAVVLIDSAPGRRALDAAAKVADAALVMFRPNRGDLSRLPETMDRLESAGVPTLVGLSQVRLGTLSTKAARQALDLDDLPLVVEVPLREQIADSFGTVPDAVTHFYLSAYLELIGLARAGVATP